MIQCIGLGATYSTKHRYHLLDLRQPKVKGEPGYRYGWLDSDTKMVYALFNILNQYVENEMPHHYCPSEEDVQAEPFLLTQRSNYLEVKNLHYWWNVGRKREEKKYLELLHVWSQAKLDQNPSEHQLWLELKKIEQANDDKLDEMITRLIKIRRSLWT